jgi:uncharacterized protein
MVNRSDQMNAVLEHLAANNSMDIQGVALISSDGMLVGSRIAADINPDRMGAVAATMVGVATRVANDLKIGKPFEAIVNAENGYFLVMPIATKLILAIILRQQANLGLVRLEARATGQAIAELMNF